MNFRTARNISGFERSADGVYGTSSCVFICNALAGGTLGSRRNFGARNSQFVSERSLTRNHPQFLAFSLFHASGVAPFLSNMRKQSVETGLLSVPSQSVLAWRRRRRPCIMILSSPAQIQAQVNMHIAREVHTSNYYRAHIAENPSAFILTNENSMYDQRRNLGVAVVGVVNVLSLQY